jgi:adenine-specific DNA-methyltransferase
MARKVNDKTVGVDAVKHKDKRKNIPTEELRDFVRDDEQKPKPVKLEGLLYARDPSLDPQLVWKGKDKLDQEDLVVPAVPIYIQEKIHPQALIEDVKAENKKSTGGQMDFFADFNGLPKDFEQRVDFYNHEGNWSNRMILGDSLVTMTSLSEKEGLKGKVQMVYIDPPYGIKFNSNWQVSTRKRDVKDGKAEDATRQPEQIRAFRDTWELGIHSYLSYWRDRLVAARELLTETGSVFVQIGDENVHLVRSLMDEVFGSDNFVSQIAVRTTMGAGSQMGTIVLPAVTSYILWYGKHAESTKIRDLYEDKADMQSASLYSLLRFPDGTERHATSEELANEKSLPQSARLFRPDTLTSQSPRNDGQFPVNYNGQQYLLGRGYWKTNREGMKRLLVANRVRPTVGESLQYVRFIDDFPVVKRNNFWADGLTGSFTEDKIYVVQSPTKIVARCMLMATDPGDLVLDPTCGSGTTAYVAEQWGRRWITIDTSRVALALARTRLMTAKYPYYLLSDSQEGVKKEAETTGVTPPPYKTDSDIKKGFVYKRVPHIQLKDIANNAEIDTIYDRWQKTLEPLREKLNKLLKTKYEDWEIPRVEELDSQKTQPRAAVLHKEAKDILEKWWDGRLRRQREIDESISRNSQMEILYDQPYLDNKRIRVTGPFTVESLSPHRTISVEEKKRLSETAGSEGFNMKLIGAGQFGNIIIENLKKAGVQNTIKQDRLKFDRLEVHPGQWIHAVGDYTEKDGKTRRAAVCIGPEHGTVGPELVKEAAKEAVQGIGFDMLIICGFAFDPHVSEEAKRYGKLTVLPTRMNADMMMGDDFLKKTGAGNLFMVFGEPDVEVKKLKDGKWQVQINGLDIYDPTTGQIRNNSTDDIACWFIDTHYNGESFFVRHAYFTGADQPYENLKRALKAEVNEEAWASLYSTISRPFEKPDTGKIAVKVINHYGDEVLKVYEIK